MRWVRLEKDSEICVGGVVKGKAEVQASDEEHEEVARC